MLTLITPTGGRPEGLALLAQYLDAQTYQGEALWIVVDDCNPMSPVPDSRFPMEVIRPSWRWQPGMNTQAQSILMALRNVPDDAVVMVVEDDDCYRERYIETMLKALQSADLVGQRDSLYYNVRTRRYQVMPGKVHSSLASTAIRGADALRAVCHTHKTLIDYTLWTGFKGRKALIDSRQCIGIKGLPGRAGIGIGHRENFGQPDTDNTLQKWIGDYAANYDNFRKAA